MSGFYLKLIAIAAMTVDHAGAVFFPDQLWMRVIGRMTMPIMCYLVAVGYSRTRNVRRYMLRMLAFGVVSIVPYTLCFYRYGGLIPTPFVIDGTPVALALDVMFTLFLGLCVLWARDNVKGGAQYAIIAGAVVLSSFCDWAIYGVLLVWGMGWAAQDQKKSCAVIAGVAALMFLSEVLQSYLGYGAVILGGWSYVMFGMLLVVPVLLLYNGKRGPDMRWFFYAYYPLHLFFIGVLALSGAF